MNTMERLSCSPGRESVTMLQKSGIGKHEICITRTTGMREHVQGVVSLKGPTGQMLFKHAYRSDFRGFCHIVTICDAGNYELKVTGCAQSVASDLFGCNDSGILVTVSPEAAAAAQWVLGKHKGSRIKWESFATREEAQGKYNKSLWSMALFSPSGLMIDSCSGPFDINGFGVAAIQRGYPTQCVGRCSPLSFSLMETSAGLAAEYPGEMEAGIQEALWRSRTELSESIRCVDSIKCDAGARDAGFKECLIDFVATSLEEMVQLLEQSFTAAGIDAADSSRILVTDAAGAVVGDWPESDEKFPLRIRYAREKLSAPQEQLHLLEHDKLVQQLYAAEGWDVTVSQAQARRLLGTFGLRAHDMGVRNVDERGKYIYNQCFYLSLARGLLGHTASQRQAQAIALKLKRSIEAAVIAERPHWKKEVGEEAQAFADFLPMAMAEKKGTSSENNLLAELAVCIVDSSSGQVEAYLGPLHQRTSDIEVQQRNLVILWYIPGHYQCVVNDDRQGSKVMMTYKDFKDLLLSQNMSVVETLG